ncbi:MAG: AAA family ATPase [Bacilli bacterium]|nr:AAA family ATPase [Bacilli bacterium]
MEEKVIFRRKIYKQMEEWIDSPVQNSALLIEGARRIGKSTIVEEFAKKRFPNNYILVDFRHESDDVKSLFNNVKDINGFFRKFFLSQNKVLKDGGLIIFDEIQFCPKAREAIKDLVNDGRYRYIETGSLISIKDNVKDIMIPSEERRIDMFPMDFEEYLWAIEDNHTFELLKDSITNHESIEIGIHKQYLEKFRTYMIIGGMPKVLSIFLQTNSFKLANDEKLDILKLYRDDLRKYDSLHNTVCTAIFDSIPSQLAKTTSNRFVIKSISGKKRYDQIRKSLDDLCDFKIVNRINTVSTLESPLAIHVEEEKFKLYFCDTGLLFSKLIQISEEKMNEIYFKFIQGKKIINIGTIFESIVAQQLISKGAKLYCHKFSLLSKEENKTKHYELDFLIEIDFKVTAIEVKSSKNYTTSSLNHIKQKYPQLKVNRMVFGVKGLSFESDKTTIPIYLCILIKN